MVALLQALGLAADGDEALMQAYAKGDQRAFAQLYDRHERPLYRFLLRSVSAEAVADDLLQEVWLGVIHSAHRYQPRAAFRTWLYQIARSKLIDHWRCREPRVVQQLYQEDAHGDGGEPVAQLAADPADQPEVRAMDGAQAQAFAGAVAALPAAQREVFLLHGEAGLTLAQIATLVGAPEETVKSRFRYACHKLRTQLREWTKA